MIPIVIYANKNLRDFGVLVDESGIFVSPSKDYELTEVPGMNGSLIFDNSRFRNVTIPISCIIRKNFKLNYTALMNYLLSLDGYQQLLMSEDPTHYRMASFLESVEPETWERNKSGQFTLVFECKPQRYLTKGSEWHAFASGSTIPNITRFNAKPVIRFYGNGSVTLGNKTVTVTGRGTDQYIDIDCEMMTCSNGSSNLSSHVTLSNGYPVIAPGGSGIEYTTDSAVENPCQIMPRWWEV